MRGSNKFLKVKCELLEHLLSWYWEIGLWGRILFRICKHKAQSKNDYDRDLYMGEKGILMDLGKV